MTKKQMGREQEITLNIRDYNFIAAPLTIEVIARRKMLERCGFERKGGEMIVRGLPCR